MGQKAAEGKRIADTPCVGRMLQVGHVAGWWSQDEPGGPPRFYFDVQGSRGWDATPEDLRTLDRMLTTGRVEDVSTAITAARGDLETGAPTRRHQ